MIKDLKEIKRILFDKVLFDLQKRSYQPNTKAIFVLGNPKSGTTAIGKLFSMATGLSITSDFIRAIKRSSLQLELLFNLLSFDDFVNEYKYEFSKDIVKEPFLTYHTKDLINHFPESEFLFVVRNPFENIRSILNRLKIPGDLHSLDFDSYRSVTNVPVWKLHLQSRMYGVDYSHYIDSMAYRWSLAAQNYLENRNRFHLVKYEDFASDKHKTILDICDRFGLDALHNIESHLDKQFQPKGVSSNPEKFFGKINYQRILSICKKQMEEFDY